MRFAKDKDRNGGVGFSAALVLGLLVFLPGRIIAQNGQIPRSGKSPKEVVQDFRGMDAAGERLTDSGWNKAAAFFVKVSPPPRKRFMTVIAQGESVYPLPADKATNKVQVEVSCSAVGQIDALGRFTRVVAPRLLDNFGLPRKELGSQVMYGPIRWLQQYVLILSETHWEFDPAGLKEVRGAPEWRIETFAFQPYVTIDTAIRYLAKLRDEPGNGIVRANASKSIAALRGIK